MKETSPENRAMQTMGSETKVANPRVESKEVNNLSGMPFANISCCFYRVLPCLEYIFVGNDLLLNIGKG